MKLFTKKETEKKCSCGGNCTTEEMEKAESTKMDKGIKVLGSGCKKCQELENATKIALKELNLDIVVDHVTDFAQIASYGVMSTPALVVNGRVVSYGKVLSVNEVKTILEKMEF